MKKLSVHTFAVNYSYKNFVRYKDYEKLTDRNKFELSEGYIQKELLIV